MEAHFLHYTLFVDEVHFEILVNGVRWFSLPARSAVDSSGQEDRDAEVLSFRTWEETGILYAEWTTHSNLWQRKTYLLEAKENGFYYRIRLKGEGAPDQIRYFADKRLIRYETGGYLLPIAVHANEAGCIRTMTQDSEITLGYLAPPMFCYPFFCEGEPGWFGLGLVARPGQYQFDRFCFQSPFGFQLPLYGKTKVCGEWESQGIWGGAGQDALGVLRAYANWHYEEGFCRRGVSSETIPRWWKGPIFCGWGSQGTVGERFQLHRDAAEPSPFCYATQEVYEKMSQILDEKKLHPSILIIDDKWQEHYGSALPDPKKWPDMRAFTDREHEKGRHVLLWFKAWNAEGLPSSECVDDLCRPVAADPTSAAYRERVRRFMHKLLSDDDGCCHCDGFKIDFANCMPLGETVTSAGDLYGVELLKELMKLLYQSAKEVRSDALINCSCGHPYFAEVCDQARLHDSSSETRLVCSTMRFRKALFDAAMPGVLIDTDGGSLQSHREFLRYLKLQPELGVPALYDLFSTTDMDTPMDEQDFSKIREVWEEYIRTLG